MGAYIPETRFLGTPTRTLLAEERHLAVPHGEEPRPERVAAALSTARAEGVARPVAMGAIPFDVTAPAALAIPHVVHQAPPLVSDSLVALPPEGLVPDEWHGRAAPARDGYAVMVDAAVDRMWRGEFSKVVLA